MKAARAREFDEMYRMLSPFERAAATAFTIECVLPVPECIRISQKWVVTKLHSRSTKYKRYYQALTWRTIYDYNRSVFNKELVSYLFLRF